MIDNPFPIWFELPFLAMILLGVAAAVIIVWVVVIDFIKERDW